MKRDLFSSTYHRDGTVTVWNVIEQRWHRAAELSDALLATLGWREREKVERHFARHGHGFLATHYPHHPSVKGTR